MILSICISSFSADRDSRKRLEKLLSEREEFQSELQKWIRIGKSLHEKVAREQNRTKQIGLLLVCPLFIEHHSRFLSMFNDEVNDIAIFHTDKY